MTTFEKLKPLSLRANFSWTFLGNVIYSASQWGILISIARFGSPDMLGQFGLALAITAPIIMLTNLHLRSIQATDAKKGYSFSHYLTLRLITIIIAQVIIVFIVLNAHYDPYLSTLIILIGISKGVESVTDIYYGLMQQQERMDRIAKSMIIKGILSLLFAIIALIATNDILFLSIALICSWSIILLIYDIKGTQFVNLNKKKYLSQQNISYLLQLTKLSFPLGIVMMLLSLNTNIPRYFIEYYLGESELGIFIAMFYLIIVGNTIVNALGQAALPRMAKYIGSANIRAYWRLLLSLNLIGITLGFISILVAIIAGKWILTLVYGVEYAAHSDVFVWIMVAGALTYISSFLGYGMTALRQFREQAVVNILFTAVILIASILLIPDYKLQGAVYAVCLLYLFQIPVKALFIVLGTRSCLSANPPRHVTSNG